MFPREREGDAGVIGRNCGRWVRKDKRCGRWIPSFATSCQECGTITPFAEELRKKPIFALRRCPNIVNGKPGKDTRPCGIEWPRSAIDCPGCGVNIAKMTAEMVKQGGVILERMLKSFEATRRRGDVENTCEKNKHRRDRVSSKKKASA